MEIRKFLKDARDCFVGDLGENRSDRNLLAMRSADVPQQRFDNAARSSANALTRREVLSAMLSGIGGVILSQFGVKTAWAALCLCGGSTYDTLTQCCVGGSTIVPKYPVRNKAACPDRRQHGDACDPNDPNDVTGCGARGDRSFPGRFGAANFKACCNVHDCCYVTCDNLKGSCDSDLLSCLNSQCTNNFPSLDLVLLCLVAARIYFEGVDRRGQNPYDKAQEAGCDCCGEQTCDNGPLPPLRGCTFPGTCDTGYFACDASNICLCGLTTEGASFCFQDNFCSDLQPCSSSFSCPPGFVCLADNCCGFNVCIAACSPAGFALPQAASTKRRTGRTASGGVRRR